MLSDRIHTNEIYNTGQTMRSKQFNKRALAFGCTRENDNSIELFKCLEEIMNRIEALEHGTKSKTRIRT